MFVPSLVQQLLLGARVRGAKIARAAETVGRDGSGIVAGRVEALLDPAFEASEEGRALLESCSAIVALHADEATEAARAPVAHGAPALHVDEHPPPCKLPTLDNLAMASHELMAAAAELTQEVGMMEKLPAAKDFSQFRRVVDVGGGKGNAVRAVLKANPQVHLPKRAAPANLGTDPE